MKIILRKIVFHLSLIMGYMKCDKILVAKTFRDINWRLIIKCD